MQRKEKNPQGCIEFYHFMSRKGTTKFKSVFRKIEFNPLIKNKVKMIKIGINGFGHIGRFVFRSTVEAENAKEVQVVTINDLCPVDLHS